MWRNLSRTALPCQMHGFDDSVTVSSHISSLWRPEQMYSILPSVTPPLDWQHAAQVACLSDGEAHLALDKDDHFAIQTKPHGHGDVHVLLHSLGLLRRWVAAGVKWVAFFQDTNALVFRGLPAAIGARVVQPPV